MFNYAKGEGRESTIMVLTHACLIVIPYTQYALL